MTETAAFTAATAQLVALAELFGLRPRVEAPRRGMVRVMLNGRGELGGFGCIEVGARTGKVLRMRLWQGNQQIDFPARKVTTTGYVASRVRLLEYRTYAQIVLGEPCGQPEPYADEALDALREDLYGDNTIGSMAVTSGTAVWGQAA